MHMGCSYVQLFGVLYWCIFLIGPERHSVTRSDMPLVCLACSSDLCCWLWHGVPAEGLQCLLTSFVTPLRGCTHRPSVCNSTVPSLAMLAPANRLTPSQLSGCTDALDLYKQS